MRLSPTQQYWMFWIVLGIAFLAGQYFVMRYAVRWGVEHSMCRLQTDDGGTCDAS